jgi:Luciferase-like monooxygenase
MFRATSEPRASPSGGTFDAVFLADTPSFADHPEYRAYQALEPVIVLGTVAAATDRIGLIGTVSSTYNDPYNPHVKQVFGGAYEARRQMPAAMHD